jgi:signal peptidase I
MILLAALLALCCKTFVLDLAVVEGPSMQPGYRSGDVVAVLRCAYGLRLPLGARLSRRYLLRWARPLPGEVVAAASPNDGGAVVKRVAARGPGELRVVDGHLVGTGLDLVLHPSEMAMMGRGFELPAESVFLLGDNLAESVDSRSYGAVPENEVAGRVLGLVWRGSGGGGGREGIDDRGRKGRPGLCEASGIRLAIRAFEIEKTGGVP